MRVLSRVPYAQIGEPTWTGRSGLAGRSAGATEGGGVLTAELLTFMRQRGGTVTLEAMVEHFGDRMQSHDAMLAFKKLLKQLARFDKHAKTWTLRIKEES